MKNYVEKIEEKTDVVYVGRSISNLIAEGHTQAVFQLSYPELFRKFFALNMYSEKVISMTALAPHTSFHMDIQQVSVTWGEWIRITVA